jgi:DNA-dependent RNA polymerase auxiliary subunit epsilon
VVRGHWFELEDDPSEYTFITTDPDGNFVDGAYVDGDDHYLVVDGLVYEEEDRGYFQKSANKLFKDGQTFDIEFMTDLPGNGSAQSIYARLSNGSLREVETEEEALSEDQSLVRLYKTVFDRDPDHGGYRYWSDRLDIDLDFSEVVRSFVASQEFAKDYAGKDKEAFLEQVYENVLERKPDQAGLNWWLQQLVEGHTDEAGVIAGFSFSNEFIGNTQQAVDDFIALAGQHSFTVDMIV